MTGKRPSIAIITGSGAAKLLPDLGHQERIEVQTPYGSPSSVPLRSNHHDADVFVLNRHGDGHVIPPHRINYRANIWALAELGCKYVLAIATVGGIRPSLKCGDLLVPDQIIDYTWGRESTFFDGVDGGGVGHLETALPYCMALREIMLRAADTVAVPVQSGGTYAATQGPRFETAAEINRIEQDGGAVVGMTGMPETTLAGEKRMCYASVNLIVNPAAGRGQNDITMDEIYNSWDIGYLNLRKLLAESIRAIASLDSETCPLNSQIMEV